jgi:hypothetical protein
VKRWLFNLATISSLILCVPTVAMWVRSYSHFDGAHYYFPPDPDKAQTNLYVQSRWGETAIYRTRSKPSPNSDLVGLRTGSVPAQVIMKHPNAVGAMSNGPLGFGFGHVADAQLSSSLRPGVPYRSTWTVIFIPYWAMIVLLAVLPCWWCLLRWRERRRQRVGHCPLCGYDLRATPDRCPECGAIRGAAAPTAA